MIPESPSCVEAVETGIKTVRKWGYTKKGISEGHEIAFGENKETHGLIIRTCPWLSNLTKLTGVAERFAKVLAESYTRSPASVLFRFPIPEVQQFLHLGDYYPLRIRHVDGKFPLNLLLGF